MVPPTIIFLNSVWTVTAGDAVSHMPLDERSRYARLYSGVENNDSIVKRLTELWVDLATYSDTRRLSDAQLFQIDNDIRRIRSIYLVLDTNQVYALQRSKELGILPAADPIPGFESRRAQVCQPLLAS